VFDAFVIRISVLMPLSAVWEWNLDSLVPSHVREELMMGQCLVFAGDIFTSSRSSHISIALRHLQQHLQLGWMQDLNLDISVIT